MWEVQGGQNSATGNQNQRGGVNKYIHSLDTCLIQYICSGCMSWGVYNRWTGPVDFTGGLETCGKNVVELCWKSTIMGSR